MMKIAIIGFEPHYRENFKDLNVEWLQKYFVVEEFDRHQLSNPESEILDKGGKIFFAKVSDKIVGTASLLKVHGVYELAKMAVTEEYKGHGIGKLLMEHCIQEAENLGSDKLILLSNRSLTPAIAMYRKFGFTEVPVEEETPYKRCNIKMELTFK